MTYLAPKGSKLCCSNDLECVRFVLTQTDIHAEVVEF